MYFWRKNIVTFIETNATKKMMPFLIFKQPKSILKPKFVTFGLWLANVGFHNPVSRETSDNNSGYWIMYCQRRFFIQVLYKETK
jgi:hypothetical protein